jgi:hypothetical protein
VADEVVNLEDETPAAVAEAPPEAPPAEAGPAEVDAVEVGGQKYVPVAALIAERAEKKTLKDRASRADVLEQENAQMRPYAQFLAAHPELMNPQPRQAPAPQQPVVDAEALQYAKELDLYKADGNPDIEKAQRLIALQDQRAARKATEAVQPYAQSIEQQQSVHNFQNALTIKGASGQTPDPQILQSLWQSVPARLSADKGVAALLHAAALGFGKGAPNVVAPPPGPPLISEATSSRPGRPSVTSLDEAVAKHRGVSAESMAKLATGFTKGRPSPLEDD